MNSEDINKKVKCCITERPMTDCKHINGVQLEFRAKWDWPVWGNIIQGISNMAMAFIHDDCIDDKGRIQGEIKFAVEFDGDNVIYHPVPEVRKCRVCGCTDMNCSQCIEKTGSPCHWVADDLCSACQL